MATDLDVDGARKVGVAVPPASKDEYLEASQQLQPGFVATVDGSDPSLGWTVQDRMTEREGLKGKDAEPKEFVEPGDTLPGQVYLPEQLPDPQAAIQAGIMPQKIPAHLVVTSENHIQGPEPSELAILDYRRKLRESVLRHRSGDAYAGVGDDEEQAADENAAKSTAKASGSDSGSSSGSGSSNSGSSSS